MKRILVASLLVVLVAITYGQMRKQYTWIGMVTNSWTAIAKTTHAKITLFQVSNDGATSADTVWVALDHDTLSANLFPLYYYNDAGESYQWPPVYIDTIRVKSNGTVQVRVIYY
jgi:hypothetical protein